MIRFSMTGFHTIVRKGNSVVSDGLIEGLNNGKPLSLYFDGIFSKIKPNGESCKIFASILRAIQRFRNLLQVPPSISQKNGSEHRVQMYAILPMLTQIAVSEIYS